MHFWEILMVSIGISLNILAVTICWGAMLQTIRKSWVIGASVIVGLWQVMVFLIGHYLVLLPVFRIAQEQITRFGRVFTCMIFIGIGAYMLFKAYNAEQLVERRKEEGYRLSDALILALLASLDAFLVGLGMAFLGTEVLESSICFAVVTALAVIAGIYMGYWIGCEKRRIAYQIGGVLLMISGVEILVNYLV